MEASEAGGGEDEEGARGVEAVVVGVGERGGDEGVDAVRVLLRADGELEVDDEGAGGGGGGREGGSMDGGRGRRGIYIGERGEAAEEVGRDGGGGLVGVAAAEEGRHGD